MLYNRHILHHVTLPIHRTVPHCTASHHDPNSISSNNSPRNFSISILRPPEAQPQSQPSTPRTRIRRLDPQRAFTADAIRLPSAPPPDLIAIDLRLLGVLTRVEQIVTVVRQDAVAVEGEARGAHALWRAAVRRREADRLRLVRDDVGFLEAGRGGVDGEEGEAVRGGGRAGDDEGFGVGLVLDLTEVGRRVGVGEGESLEVVGVEAAAADGEAEGRVGLAGGEDGGGGGEGGEEGQSGGGEG